MSEYTDRIVQQTEAMLHFQHDETLQQTTPQRLHECLGRVIMMEISDAWTKTKRRQDEEKRAFYFSAEYLVGRLVYSNLFNLGILGFGFVSAPYASCSHFLTDVLELVEVGNWRYRRNR